MINKKNLEAALVRSIDSGMHETVSDVYSARIRSNGDIFEALLIDHNKLKLKARVDIYSPTITHDVLTKVVDEIAEKMDYSYNLMGIYTYEDLLKHLLGGWKFGYVMDYRDGTKGINVVLSADRHYIHWTNYGSSANKATAKDLKWVIEQIFESNIPEFIRKYIMFL